MSNTTSAPAATLDPTCLIGVAGTPLPSVLDAAGNETCASGFYCPNLNPADPATFPIACIPTPDCQADRLFGGECDEQSPYEPLLCSLGTYCPTATQQLICPEGSFCPLGSIEPQPCPALSLCPEESSHPRSGLPLLLCLLIYLAFAVLRWQYLKTWRLRGQVPGQSTIVDGSSFTAPQGMPHSTVEGEVEMLPTKTTAEGSGSGNNEALANHFRSVSEGQTPIQIDFRDLRVTLPAKPGESEGRVLLQGVSGSLKPGTVTAILGPSGAGKTVLLTTLLQRIDPSWRVEGHLEVNKGRGNFADLRSSIGFVPQDDVLHNELTVEANLYYASELRLPASWGADRRHAMREVVLEALGLLPHRATPIGTETERGVSGGQRKRVSIGVELASAPLMVLLDEPTSGLDSTTSLELVTVLKDVAVAANITIAMVIHQPRVEIWDALDELLILGVGGRTVYKGPQADVHEYFLAHNIDFDPTKNPADVVLDAVVQDSAGFADKWAVRTANQHSSEPVTPLHLAPDAGAGFRGASPPRQFVLFMLRSFEKQLSDMTAFVVESVVILLCGFILGNSMADFSLDGSYRYPYGAISPTTFQLLLPQLHMYQLMSLGLAASVAGVSVFGIERPQYFREVPTGLNRASYFLANVTAALPRVFLVSLVYASFFTFLAALVVPFRYLYFCVALSYWGIYGFGACISVTATKQSAPLIASTGAIVFAVFNGFINFPEFLQRLTPGFYASQVLQEQHAKYITHWAADAMATQVTNYEAGRITESFALMIVICIVLHAIAFALMVFTHRAQQR